MKYYLLAVAVLSVIAFLLYGIDKRKAKAKRWRIPEATLLGIGIIGGAPGALLGMMAWRHKTRHWYFWAVNFLGLAIIAAVCIYSLIR